MVNETVIEEKEIRAILETVVDPEVPVLTIYDLGIVRAIKINGEEIEVIITPTYSGCPAMDMIRDEIRASLTSHGVLNFSIEQVLSPAWTTDWMTDSGKQKLQEYGIAVPAKSGCFLTAEDHPESCPHCHSTHIEMISRFGSTACKALYRCLDCKEPFDYFKCH